MRKDNRNPARGASGIAAKSVQGVMLAALLGVAPLAATWAAAPDGASPRLEPAVSAAAIELVPVPLTDEAVITAPDTEMLEAPSAPQETVLGRGSASYYAAKFHGRRTASGERFDNDAMTAAHRTLPFGSLVRVTNRSNGRSVVVRINDRGPFSHGRVIDVSRAAAAELGLVARGHGEVEIALIED